jgi:hypothetical protein
MLLSLLMVGERAMPCSDHDDCAEDESSGAAHVEHSSDEPDHPSDESGSHCSHCSCPCHIPAVIKTYTLPATQPRMSEFFSSRTQSPPTYPVDPLDHVPLL